MAAAGGSDVLGLKRIREKPLRVVWIDTEQSADSTHEILRDRIGAMKGAEASEEAYHVFNLRQVRWQDRMTLVHANAPHPWPKGIPITTPTETF